MRYVLKLLWQALLWLDLFLITFLLYPPALLPQAITKPWYPKLFQCWCWVFIHALGIRLQIHQHYIGKLPEHYIVISNHPSAFEDIGMPAIFHARFLAKEEVKSWWFAGKMSVAARFIFVKRDCKNSKNNAKQALIQALNKGENIGLYPEGGCHGRKIHVPFHLGIFDAAFQTNTPIIPVFLEYEAEEDFEWLGQTLPQKIVELAKAKNKNAHYHIFDPIVPSEFDSAKAMLTHTEKLYLGWQERLLS